MFQQAEHEGISERTLRRAKDQLGSNGSNVFRAGYGDRGQWLWKLPTKDDQSLFMTMWPSMTNGHL